MCQTTATAPTFEQVRQACQAAGIITAHLINADCAVVPSATTRDTEYILVRVNGAWRCNCPAPGRCWHQDRAAQLAAVTAPAPVVDKQARYRAALADVFGAAA
jgi:hypothetical protein